MTLPHRLNAPSPRRHDDPTLQTLPPRRHDYPPSPPSSIATTDIPPESVDSSDIPPSDFGPYGYPSDIPPSSVGLYRKTFSCDITALPSEFDTHPARMTIVHLLELEPDLTHQIWRRRTIYIEENFTEWQENSSPPNKPHREQREFMSKDLNTASLLKFPGLRAADKKILEGAWRTYRPFLLEKIQQALTLGCDWKKILQKLNLAFSDAKSGYPRLKQYVELALGSEAEPCCVWRPPRSSVYCRRVVVLYICAVYWGQRTCYIMYSTPITVVCVQQYIHA